MDLMEIVEDLRDSERPRRLYALVVGIKVYAMIRDLQPGPVVTNYVSHPDTLWGFRIHSFPDVPNHWITGFYDQGTLDKYLRLREKIGHNLAMQRLSPYGLHYHTKDYPPTNDDS